MIEIIINDVNYCNIVYDNFYAVLTLIFGSKKCNHKKGRHTYPRIAVLIMVWILVTKIVDTLAPDSKSL